MELKKIRAISVIILLILVLASSCGTSKKAAITCPAFPYYKNNFTVIGHAKKKGLPVHGRIVGKKQHTRLIEKNSKQKESCVNHSSCFISFYLTEDIPQLPR